MFSKVLVANRGIVRLNCIRAIQELGAKAAALYTAEEPLGRGIRMADEAHQISATKHGEEYYNEDGIVQIARAIGADAVHPGYGFLAQNGRFARKLSEAGITLISSLFGDREDHTLDKPHLKEIAHRANLPIVKGSSPCTSLAEVQKAAKEIGYPVVLKAVAGYSGRGIRIVTKEVELTPAYEFVLARIESLLLSCREVYVEKLISHAHHIEIPVLRDKQGNVVVFPELDSSVQRRFQKFIVETPSPFIDKALVKTLAGLSRKLVEKLEFVGFASVEYLVQKGEAWFLELNGFVQPAHVATNEICGVNLIREQIRIFAGESLTISTEDVRARGHAISISINAENPGTNFTPSPGVIKRFDLASGTGIIVYADVHAGESISSFYDPMIAQCVFTDRTREEALARLHAGLNSFIIEGIKTNLPFLKALTMTNEFESAKIDIGYINDRNNLRRILEQTMPAEEEVVAAIVAALAFHNDAGNKHILDEAQQRAGEHSIWNFASRFFSR